MCWVSRHSSSALFKNSFLLLLLCTYIQCRQSNNTKLLTPPEDTTISQHLIKNYLNKVYIQALSRKPTAAERATVLEFITPDNYATHNRRQFLEKLFNQPEYATKMSEIARLEYLENVSKNQIATELEEHKRLLNNQDLALVFDMIRDGIDQLEKLENLDKDLNNGLSISSFHSRCVDNRIYDKINMGTDNFVRSCFQHFVMRYPTEAELEQCKRMIGGAPGQLFLQSGQSKEDFLDLFFNSDSYIEGQVRYWFLRYLLREPNVAEMVRFCHLFKSSMDIRMLQIEILVLDEFFGLK